MYIVIVVKSIYIRVHKILVLHNHNLCQFVLLLSRTVYTVCQTITIFERYYLGSLCICNGVLHKRGLVIEVMVTKLCGKVP